jgi:hypothetical protein
VLVSARKVKFHVPTVPTVLGKASLASIHPWRKSCCVELRTVCKEPKGTGGEYACGMRKSTN